MARSMAIRSALRYKSVKKSKSSVAPEAKKPKSMGAMLSKGKC